MAKLTENSSRDVQIAFANELSVICDKLDINVWELIALANRHPRVNILQPGPASVATALLLIHGLSFQKRQQKLRLFIRHVKLMTVSLVGLSVR